MAESTVSSFSILCLEPLRSSLFYLLTFEKVAAIRVCKNSQNESDNFLLCLSAQRPLIMHFSLLKFFSYLMQKLYIDPAGV